MSLHRHFAAQATSRAVLLLGLMMLFSWVLWRTNFVITPIVLALGCVALVVEFVYFVQRTNREVARFFDSIRHGDFSHRVDPDLRGARFQELAQSMRGVVARLQDMRHAGEEDRQRLQAIVEHVPVPMFSVLDGERVRLHNHAARRLFAATPVTTLADLDRLGPELGPAVRTQAPGHSRVVRIEVPDGGAQRMTLSLTQIVVGQHRQRLITLQNISDALAASELEAWQQMAQVLAHEIMNSLTPVASLAGTAQTLLASPREEDHAQARAAVTTVARRADTLMTFVQGYRQFTRLPAPTLATFDLGELLRHVAALVEPQVQDGGIALDVAAPAGELPLRADRGQLEQVLINLVRNAMEAVRDVPSPHIRLVASIGRAGRTQIAVADNGPGIPPALRERIFVPYYTTRERGTGVGLALTRQVMVAHQGTVDVGASALGGAQFTLRF